MSKFLQVGKIRLQILAEDRDFIAINKPAGLLSVPIPKSKAFNTLELVKKHLKGKKEWGLTVHRIDRYTSGIIVFAKNRPARHEMVQQFLAHTPKRVYHTLVWGVPKKDSDRLRHFMVKRKEGFKNEVVEPGTEGAAPAEMRFKVLEKYGTEASLIEVELITGFKNQIRAQLAYIGCPVIGDRPYGTGEDHELIDRHALHSYKLEFNHPTTKKPVKITAHYPLDFNNLLQEFRNKGNDTKV